jgi:hypothetical protein
MLPALRLRGQGGAGKRDQQNQMRKRKPGVHFTAVFYL